MIVVVSATLSLASVVVSLYTMLATRRRSFPLIRQALDRGEKPDDMPWVWRGPARKILAGKL